MFVKTEVDGFGWLENNCWSGAIDTLNKIREWNMEDQFMDYLEDMFYLGEDIPTLTELNDFLWFDDEMIFSDLGITDEEEEDDFWEEDEEEEGEEDDE